MGQRVPDRPDAGERRRDPVTWREFWKPGWGRLRAMPFPYVPDSKRAARDNLQTLGATETARLTEAWSAIWWAARGEFHKAELLRDLWNEDKEYGDFEATFRAENAEGRRLRNTLSKAMAAVLAARGLGRPAHAAMLAIAVGLERPVTLHRLHGAETRLELKGREDAWRQRLHRAGRP
jgi:hypothetical protein